MPRVTRQQIDAIRNRYGAHPPTDIRILLQALDEAKQQMKEWRQIAVKNEVEYRKLSAEFDKVLEELAEFN